MQVESMPIGSLLEDPSNVRKHEPKNIDSIKGSLTKFGQQKPIVVDRNNIVVAGNGTLAAARALKWDSINIVRTDLVGSEAAAFAIADNRTAELAAWDDGALSKTLESLQKEGLDLSAIGFDSDDLTQWLKAPETLPPGCDEDEVPEHVEPKTKLGDLYQLGDHRLLCGDSTDILQVERLMDGTKADMVFTDPPYGIDLNTDYSKRAGGGRTFRKIESDDKPFDAAFILEIFKCAREIFLFGPNNYCHTIPNYLSGVWGVWEKKDAASDTTHQGAFELWWSKVRHRAEICRVRWLACDTDKDTKGTRVHPTQKPVALAEWFFGRWGKPTDLIVDLFLGSGSTLIACEKTKRKCYGMELDPHYCDVIVARWEKFTGKKASIINSEGL